MTNDLKNKLLGGLYGLLIGDAAGVPYEFNDPSNLPPFGQIDMVPPATFSCTYPSVPTGTWSDDGALALCLLETLLECPTGLDTQLLMNKMAAWRYSGRLAVDNRVFDVRST
jgi:ADP-ribosylglycohydrolase